MTVTFEATVETQSPGNIHEYRVPSSPSSELGPNQRSRVIVRIERLEILQPFAHAHELDR